MSKFPHANIWLQINSVPYRTSPIVLTFRSPNANNIHDNKLEGTAIVIVGGIEYHKMAADKGSEQNTNTEARRVRW